MDIKKTQGLGAQGYSVFTIDGMEVNPNGLESKVAGGVHSVSNNIYKNKGLDGLSTKDDIIRVIKEGVTGNNTPSIVDVAKKFPDYIARHLLEAN